MKPAPLVRLKTALFLSLLFAATNPLFCENFAQTSQDLSIGNSLELSRPVRSWEFLDAVGQRAALFGNESGEMEAWIYPLKLFRNFRLRFHVSGQVLPAAELARQVIVTPEASTIRYSDAAFTVRETFVVPATEAGAIIRLEIDASGPMQIEAQFIRDFQLMWPAAIGGTYMSWDDSLKAFTFGHEQRQFAGIVGSPDAVEHSSELFTNSVSNETSGLMLRSVGKGHSTQYIFIAGSTGGPDEARQNYQRISSSSDQLIARSKNYYADYLNRTITLSLPDARLQSAYDWSRVSVIQGLVNNPFLGAGLIAGYRTSGNSGRPGFAWFFGRDSLWTDLALDAIGDFSTTRTALEFISKYQRADGKVEHEISQAASLVPWFKDFPYAYASADATPLYILAVHDYVLASGDIAFLNQHWDNTWRAYQFLRSTYDQRGLPQNFGIGHGWVEGGPLLPVKTELYQSALGAAALNALSQLARLAGKPEIERQLQSEFTTHQKLINQTFWSGEKNMLVFALNQNDQRVEVPTVLSTAPMWFKVFDESEASATIDRLAAADQSADWGMRIISNQNPLFDPTGYHFGSVWPLFTGWASLGEYLYHRSTPAYANLQANSQLALDGPLGHVTEVLSGSYYEALATSSPHQIWSSAMVLTPLVRGLLGISSSAVGHTVRVAPHLPADWGSWSAKNVPACGGTVDLVYNKSSTDISLQVIRQGSDACNLIFSPAVSLRARLSGAKVEDTANDKHPTITLPLVNGSNMAKLAVSDDFGIVVPTPLPELGEGSRNLKITSEKWSADRKQLQLQLNGLSGGKYKLLGYGSKIASVEGGKLLRSNSDAQPVEVEFPQTGSTAGYRMQKLVLTFAQ